MGSKLEEERHTHAALAPQHADLEAIEARGLEALGRQLKDEQAALGQMQELITAAPGQLEALSARVRSLNQSTDTGHRLWLRYGEPLSAAFGVLFTLSLFRAADPLSLGWTRWCAAAGLGLGVWVAWLRWRRRGR